MREEIASLVIDLGTADQALHTGMRTYRHGRLWGIPVVLVFSRWGKVAAASTVTHLIAHPMGTHLNRGLQQRSRTVESPSA